VTGLCCASAGFGPDGMIRQLLFRFGPEEFQPLLQVVEGRCEGNRNVPSRPAMG
jgi:hypothetical protein